MFALICLLILVFLQEKEKEIKSVHYKLFGCTKLIFHFWFVLVEFPQW